MTRFSDATRQQKLVVLIGAAVLLCILPFIVQMAGNAWVRIIDIALLYVLLALGLNIVVGYAGLLDLGYVAFYAVGAYMLGLLASPQLTDTFATFKNAFPRRPAHAVVGRDPARRAGRRRRRRPARRADAEAARRLPGDRHAGLRRDRPRLHEQPRRAGQHHQRPEGHRQHRRDLDLRLLARQDAPLLRPRVAQGHELLLPVPDAGDVRGR